MSARLSWRTARVRLHALAAPLTPVELALDEAIGSVLAEPLVATRGIPHYASSAMDGWAVAGPAPWSPAATAALTQGEALAVATGDPVPAGASEVVPQEEVRVAGLAIVPLHPHTPRPGRHVRSVGEEAAPGEIVLPVGTVLNPAALALAAACDRDSLLVRPRPRVIALLTGDEVDASGAPPAGRVRDSFGPSLGPLLASLDAQLVRAERVGDDADELRAALERARDVADLVITTGATGESSRDHLRPVLRGLEAELVVPGVVSRPGGPTVGARLQGGTALLGLPGNPLAAFLGVVGFVPPLVAGLTALPFAELAHVELTEPLPRRAAGTRLVPALLVGNRAQPLAWHGAAMLRGLAQADGIVVTDGDPGAGEEAGWIPLPWGRGRTA